MNEFERAVISRLDAILERFDKAIRVMELGPRLEAAGEVIREEDPKSSPESNPFGSPRSRDSKERLSEGLYLKMGPQVVEKILEDEGLPYVELAELLGTSEKTISRTVKRLSEDNVLSVKDGSVLVNDRDEALRWLDKFQDPIPAAGLDNHTKRQAGKVIKILLHPDVVSVGRVSTRIADEMGLGRPTVDRLLRMMIQELGLLVKGPTGTTGGLVRIRTRSIEAAKRWVTEIDSIPEEHPPAWEGHDGISDAAYTEHAPLVVDLLLSFPKGLTFSDISDKTGTKQNMLRAVLMRLHRQDKVGIAVGEKTASGSYMIRLVNIPQAESWLGDVTKPLSRGKEVKTSRQETFPSVDSVI